MDSIFQKLWLCCKGAFIFSPIAHCQKACSPDHFCPLLLSLGLLHKYPLVGPILGTTELQGPSPKPPLPPPLQ